MGRSRKIIGVVLVLAGAGHGIAAQEPEELPTPCQTSACEFVLDWTDNDPNVNDRRYGNLYEFEPLLFGLLQEAGYRFTGRGGPEPGQNVAVMYVQPDIIRAMCDQLPGTSTNRNCQAIGTVRVEIRNAGPDADIGGPLRVRSRCGADGVMTVVRMSEHVAATIDYELHKEEEGRQRPRSRC